MMDPAMLYGVDMFRDNIILRSDSYKYQHPRMEPNGTRYVRSYFESRVGAMFNTTVMIGLQALLKKNFVGQVITRTKVDEAEYVINKHLGIGAFDRTMWDYIVEKHNGRLPLRIRAVPEGTPVDVSNVLMFVENTDPNCPGLTNFMETILTHIWAPCTVASMCRWLKLKFKEYFNETADIDASIDFFLHDFGFRGVSSIESAGYCGLGHLALFKGTDNLEALTYVMKYYNSDVCAYSVPASEHSIMTALGEDGEDQVYEDLFQKFPKGILSLVIDSYNWERVARDVLGGKFRDLILGREGVTVARPDSGDPVEVMSGLLSIFSEKFGYKTNSKGYKVIPDQIRLLWGDGIDKDGILGILDYMVKEKYSINNLACFGMGGGLLQKINRDFMRFAFKSCEQCRLEEGKEVWYDIYKKPTDMSKASKRGYLSLIKENGVYKTVKGPRDDDLLVPVFDNGVLLQDYTFDEVRARAAI